MNMNMNMNMNRDISVSRDLLLRRGAIGTCVVAAVALLCVFYSVVAGAVDRAAQRRATQVAEATVSGYRPVVSAAVTAQNNSSFRGAAFGPRTVSYVRFVP